MNKRDYKKKWKHYHFLLAQVKYEYDPIKRKELLLKVTRLGDRYNIDPNSIQHPRPKSRKEKKRLKALK